MQRTAKMIFQFFAYSHSLTRFFAILAVVENWVNYNLYFGPLWVHLSLQFFVYLYNQAKNRSYFYLKIGLLKSVDAVFVPCWQIPKTVPRGTLLSLQSNSVPLA